MRHPAVPPIVSDSVARSIEADQQLAESARQLANRSITIAAEILESGSPKAQLDIIKALMPAVGRGLMQKQESDEIIELRAALESLQRAMLEMTPTATVTPITGE